MFVANNVDSLGEIYYELMEKILSEGIDITPRANLGGDETKEIRPVYLGFQNPRKRLLFIKYRDINPFFLVAESLWILSGRETVHPLQLFNSNISKFSDDGLYFHAPYGQRLRSFGSSFDINLELERTMNSISNDSPVDQLKIISEMLIETPDTRQAVASIWNPIQDLNIKTKDLPCNDLLLFKIREGKLDLTVQNRSNDFHWGLPTNIFQFTSILEVMAYVVGAEVGTYYHQTDSLHIYKSNPITKTTIDLRFKYDCPENIYDIVSPSAFSLRHLPEPRIRFDMVFGAINMAMFFIEDLDNLFNSMEEGCFVKLENGKREFRDEVCDIADMVEMAYETYYAQNFYYSFVADHSDYMRSQLDFVVSYYTYKKLAKYIKADEEDLARMYAMITLELMKRVNQDDLLLLGLNFLHTRLDALDFKTHGQNINIKTLMVGLFDLMHKRGFAQGKDFVIESMMIRS